MLGGGFMWLREPPMGGCPATTTLDPPLAAFGKLPERDLVALASSYQRYTMFQVMSACAAPVYRV